MKIKIIKIYGGACCVRRRESRVKERQLETAWKLHTCHPSMKVSTFSITASDLEFELHALSICHVAFYYYSQQLLLIEVNPKAIAS